MGIGKKKRAHVVSDREKWGMIFKALKLMLNKQQSQLDSLIEQRNNLEQRIKILHDRWISDVRLTEGHISQMRKQLALAELATLVEVSKADLVNSFKKRDALLYKIKLEHASSELHDFKAWFDILSHRCSDNEDISLKKLYESLKETGDRDSISKRVSTRHCKTLENEAGRLKHEYEKLSLRSSSEKSALQAEINFVWNQFKEMEGKYTDQLQTKSDEVDKANGKIMKLIESLEQLQSSNIEKDEKIDTLTAYITKLEAQVNKKDRKVSKLQKELESSKSSNLKTRSASRGKGCVKKPELTDATCTETKEKNGEISEVSKEVQLLRSKTVAATTPVLKRCRYEPSSSRLSGRNGGNKGGVESAVELEDEQQDSSRRSKRKHSDMDKDETPKLFTSHFRIPKVKTQSPHGR